MKRDPFWKSTAILLDYKRQLLVALGGALVSAACFGAGLGMMYPTLLLLLQEKMTLGQVAERYLMKPGRPEFVRSIGESLVAHLPTDPFHSFVIAMATIAVLTAIGSVGRYVHEFMTVTISLRCSQVWRSRVFYRLIHAPLDGVIAKGYSDNISRLISDTNQLGSGYQAILGKTTAELLKGAAAVVAALVINPWLTMLALVAAPLIGVSLRKFGKRIKRASRQASQQRGRMLASLNEAMSGLGVVKVHNAEGYERRRFHRLNRELVTQQMTARQAKALASPVIDTLTLLSVIAVAIVAAWLIFRKGFSAEEFMAVLVSLAAAGASMKPLTGLNNDLNESGAAAARVFEALELPIEPLWKERRDDLPAAPRHASEVLFENVTYAYPGKDRPAIDGVTLRVKHGQTVAIVGGNGAGKTTLLSLLSRLYAPSSGRVLIDGVDVSTVGLRSLRGQLAVVTQQAQLFEGTIAENIAYGRRHVPLDLIERSARAAHADEFIRQLPQGFQSKLGEGGTGLSGGQRQRVCIARAVLRDPTILILDEATSQVDADSEAKINQALRELRRGRTTFIIAHRLSTVVDADVIVVMDQGRIVDQGSHAELLQRCAIYQTLTQTQLLRASA